MSKARRIRDPVHDFIPFGTDKFEQMAWRLLELPEFQRLRRIKQLGFSELVFPGATHTRFAHSVGVFHTARQLAECIKFQVGNNYNEDNRDSAKSGSGTLILSCIKDNANLRPSRVNEFDMRGSGPAALNA